MKSRLALNVAAQLCLGVMLTPANAAIYIYEINASYSSSLPSSITGSFTIDDSIGPASIANVDIHATLPLAGGPFNFSFDQVVNPDQAWNVGLFWFSNQSFGAGDTHFFAFFRPDTSSNDGSYIIGQKLSGNFNQSEISVAGVNDWVDIEGRMTRELASAIPEPSTWEMLLIGFAGIGVVGYRRRFRNANRCML
jgi:hypothetical protein